MAIYGYARVSTADQAEGTSLENQARQVEGAAMMLGEDITDIFQDAGASGGTPLEQRPSGANLLDTVQAGDTIIAAKLDRVFRNAQDALNKAQEWKDAGVKLIILDMGMEPVTENGVSKLMFTVLAAVADMERERIADRMQEGRDAKKAKGGFIGGCRAPFGYDKVGQGRDSVIEKNEQEQQAIEFIAENMDMGSRKLAERARKKFAVKISHATVVKVKKDIAAERENAG